MATTIKWAAPETIATALSTELNSLGSGSLSAASAAIDNETGLYEFMEVELVLASLTPTGVPYCKLYLVKQIDGTNYEDFSTSSVHQVIAAFPFSTATAAKRVIVAGLLIPPCPFKLGLENIAGVALGASGNTVKYRRYNEQQV